VVYVEDDFSWLPRPEAKQRMDDWWNAYWEANFDLEKTIEFDERLERGAEDDPSKPKTGSRNHLLILRRKGSAGSAAAGASDQDGPRLWGVAGPSRSASESLTNDEICGLGSATPHSRGPTRLLALALALNLALPPAHTPSHES
jgi:hypothetical protein